MNHVKVEILSKEVTALICIITEWGTEPCSQSACVIKLAIVNEKNPHYFSGKFNCNKLRVLQTGNDTFKIQGMFA